MESMDMCRCKKMDRKDIFGTRKGHHIMREIVLCGASAYSKKFYIDQNFKNLPDSIKDELKIMCVLFTEDIGGVLELVFDEEGQLEFRASCDEGDLLYDDIGCGLKIRELQRTKEDLLTGLELYYKVLTGQFDEEE